MLLCPKNFNVLKYIIFNKFWTIYSENYLIISNTVKALLAYYKIVTYLNNRLKIKFKN